MKYLKITEDEYGRLAIDKTNEEFSDDRYGFRTLEGVIYPCELYLAVVLSDEICSIDSRNHYIEHLKAVKMDDVQSLQQYQETDNVFVKDVKNKLPDPYTEKLAPFTTAVVLACLKYAKSTALTSEQHQKKMNIQRHIRTLIGSDEEISLKKASELLSYYGLDISVLLKSDLAIVKS